MKCKEIIEILESEVPLSYAEPWDNPGFLVGDSQQEVEKIMVVLDITNEVVEAAKKEHADFILAHHPVIFSKIKKCTDEHFVQKKLLNLIRNGISCYGMHTNYDVCRMGSIVAKKLDLCVENVVETTVFEEMKAKGIGTFGVLSEETDLKTYAEHVKDVFHLERVTVYGNLNQNIRKIAVVPGSGRSLIEKAAEGKADVIITGDIGHHEGLDAADMGLCVIDAGHYGLEQVFIDDMKAFLEEKLPECEVISYKTGVPYQIL